MNRIEAKQLHLANAICKVLANPTEHTVFDLVTSSHRSLKMGDTGLILCEVHEAITWAFESQKSGLPPKIPA